MATEQPSLYDFSADTGIVIPDTSNVRSSIVDTFVAKFGSNIDTSEETHIGRFIDEITEVVVQTTGVNAQNANQFNLNYATGTFLDNLGAAFGVSRLTASKSTVTVTMKCSSGNMTIPSGTLFTSTDGYDFSLTQDVPVTSANEQAEGGVTQYVVTGTAQAVDDGRIYCQAGTLTKVKTAVTGLVSVINNVSATLGRLDETDAHYRNRIKKARYSGAASPSAMMNALYSLKDGSGNQDVSEAVVMENGRAYPVVKNGIALPAHSVYVCVVADSGANSTIADAIYRTKTAGADYTTKTVCSALWANRVQVQVQDEATLVNSTVTFFHPVERGLTVNVTADLSNYTGANAKQAITGAIQDYLASQGIGAYVSETLLVAAITEKLGTSVAVRSLAMTYDSVPKEEVQLTHGDIFTISTDQSADPKLVVNVTAAGAG